MHAYCQKPTASFAYLLLAMGQLIYFFSLMWKIHVPFRTAPSHFSAKNFINCGNAVTAMCLESPRNHTHAGELRIMNIQQNEKVQRVDRQSVSVWEIARAVVIGFRRALFSCCSMYACTYISQLTLIKRSINFVDVYSVMTFISIISWK